jgi:hypothetical protein
MEMSKAAAEPSMDDILSSIRQIITEDDANASSDDTEQQKSPEQVQMSNAKNEQDDALELSSSQIVDDGIGDIDFNPGEQNDPILKPEPKPEPAPEPKTQKPNPIEEMVIADDISFDEVATPLEPVAASSSKSLPDPDLSADIAEKLIEPATGAVVSTAFAKLGNLGFSDQDLTVENMIREMLRPMLKSWLDENLPSIVETMVRKEIERLSRGA